MNTLEAAMNRWPQILTEIGIEQKFLVNRHGPCPLCGGTKPFRFDDKGGLGTWICTHCGAGNGIDLVMKFKGLTFAEAAREVDRITGREVGPRETRIKSDPRVLLRKIHERLIPATAHDPVGRYLERRGLFIPEFGVKLHPEMAYFEDGKYVSTHPAMVCEFRNTSRKTITYHVTYLTSDGEKANVPSPKKLMTPIEPLAGGAVMIAKPDFTLGVAEGLETALAAMVLHQIPVWSCANACLLEKFEPPECAKDIVIFGDNDANYAGHASAFRLAHKLSVKGLHVTVLMPPHFGDWNDFLTTGKTDDRIQSTSH